VKVTDREFLTWVHDRLQHVHGEPVNIDYMNKLRCIINATSPAVETPNVVCEILPADKPAGAAWSGDTYGKLATVYQVRGGILNMADGTFKGYTLAGLESRDSEPFLTRDEAVAWVEKAVG